MNPTESEKAAMIRAITAVADNEFGKGGWKLRKRQRDIADHIHWHAEPIQ
jgi:hypothetical protein